MIDQERTKSELITELSELRTRLARFELDVAGRNAVVPVAAVTEGCFQILFEKASEGILVADALTRRIVRANPAACEMFGYTVDLMTGMLVEELHPYQEREFVISSFRVNAENSGSEELEIGCLTSDGRTFPAEVRVSRVTINGQPHVVGFFTDISSRRRTENLVRVQRDLAQTLNATNDLETALRACLATVITSSGMDSGGIYLVDSATGDLDMVCSEGLSPEFTEKVAHYDADSPNARATMDGSTLYHSYIQLTQHVGKPAESEGLKATAVVPVKHDNRVIACLNVASHALDEVSELSRHTIETIAASIGSAIVRLRAEQAVRESENRFRELTDHINDAFWILSPGWNEVLYISPAFERIWGLPCEALYRSPSSWFRAIHEDDRDRVQARITDAKLGNWAHARNIEYRIIHPDGTIRWIRARAFPVQDDAGQLVRVIGVASDITEQRRAEQQLHASESRYREIFNTMQEGIAIIDEDQITEFANPAFASIFDETEVKAIVGRSLFDYLPESEQTMAVRKAIRRPVGPRSAERTSPFELEVVTSGGNHKTILLLATSRFDEKNRFIGSIALVVDVTQVKQAEDALKESEARFRELSDLLPQIVFELDADGYVLYSNQFGFENTGFSQLDIDAGLHMAAVIAPEDRDRAQEHIMQILENRGREGQEYLIQRKDGSTFPAIIYGSPIIRNGKAVGARGIAVDITDRKKAESALRDSEERWSFALEGSGEGVWDWNTQTNEVIFSRQWKAMLGYDEDDIGSTLDEWSSRVHPDDLEAVQAEIKKHFSGELPAYTSEHRLRCKDGSYKWILDRGKVISWGSDGNPLRIIGTHTDICTRKRAEEELAHTKAFLSAAIEQSPAGVLIAEAPDVKITLANSAALGIRGGTERPLTDIPAQLHPENWQVYRPDGTLFRGEDLPLSRAVLEGVTSHNVEAVIRQADGSDKFVLANASPIRSKDGTITAGIVVFSDITERKQIEEALNESEARYRHIVEASPFGMHMYRLEPDGRLILEGANPAADWILKIEHSKLTGKTIEEAFPALVGTEVPEQYRRTARDGVRWRNEDVAYEDNRIKGAFEIAAFQRSPMRMAVVFKDISERKQAEEALRDSQKRLTDVIGFLPDATFAIDRQGQVIVWNRAMEEMTGVKSEEMLHKGDFEYSIPFYGERRPILIDLALKPNEEDRARYVFVETQGDVVMGEAHALLKGVVRNLWGKASPLYDDHGNIVGAIESIRDVTEFKQAEEALREREARLSGIMLSAPMGIGLVSNRVLQHVNKTFCDMVGYSEEELLNRSVAMLYFTGEEFDRVGAEYFRMSASGISTIETRWRRKDGSSIDVILSVTPLDRGDWSKGITFTALDITERKKAERDLTVAEEQYRVLFERAGEGILVTRGEYFQFANPAFCALSGYSLEEMPSVRIEDFIHPDHRVMVMDRYRRRLAGEDVPTGYDFKAATKDGQTKWLRMNSTVILWKGERATLNFMEDITIGRASQEEIRKFKTISDNATYGTAISDLDGKLLYVNDAFARMHDYRPEELLGQNLAVLHSDEQESVVRRINADLIATGSFVSMEVWHRRRDGTEFPTLMNGVVIRDDAGQAQYLAATAADITELKRLQEFADRARRLEAAGRIAGQVAHDFNNLLGPLVAYPEFIKEEIGFDHPAIAYLSTMEAAAQQMADINQQLLSLGRRGHYNLEPLNLNEVVRQVLKQAQLQTGRIDIVMELAGDLMNIKAGAAQIIRVFTNLISNAVDAMQGVGTLTVSTENWYADNLRGSYGQIERGEYVKVTVADTGCGIPQTILGQVFEPFFTTKKADKQRGSGLGLSVVHAIVDDHGGYVDIESTEGQGTSVFLYFPITREEQTTFNDNQIVGGTESILLVDDDRVQQEVTTRLLHRLGYRVVAVSSGEAAVEQVRSESFDLLLLDMIMPGGMDGVETYRCIKEHRPDQKAIIVSGFAENDRVAEAHQLGAGGYLKKPLTLKSLAQAVRRELDRIPDLQPV